MRDFLFIVAGVAIAFLGWTSHHYVQRRWGYAQPGSGNDVGAGDTPTARQPDQTGAPPPETPGEEAPTEEAPAAEQAPPAEQGPAAEQPTAPTGPKASPDDGS